MAVRNSFRRRLLLVRRTVHYSIGVFTAVYIQCAVGDGKTYERANNVCVKCFLARVKFEPNFTLFCRKRELCRDFALFGVTLKAVNL